MSQPVFSTRQAIEEASKCLLCHDAPCSKNCPAGTDPASFIRSIRFENFEQAAKTIREANILGGVCADVCPYSKLCEKECVRAEIDKPIQIGKLQKFAVKYEQNNNLNFLPKNPKSQKGKVAIIGSGPAGLSGAAELALNGYHVTIFEKDKTPGGIISNGIAPNRLKQSDVDYEINMVKSLGVNIECEKELGKDFTLGELQKKYNAVLLATGCHKSKTPGLTASLNGVYTALDYLANSTLRTGKIKTGRHVVVIGGGDTAIDCATTAKETGAETVTILYRRRLNDMPASLEELAHAHDLKIDFFTKFPPLEYVQSNNSVTAVKSKSTYSESEIYLQADMIIEAIGQESMLPDFKIKGLEFNKSSIKTNVENYSTSIHGVFAAGDAVSGGDTVVKAVKEGKEAAKDIINYLQNNNLKKSQSPKNLKPKNLEIDFCGVKCENPFFLSSSPVGSNYDMCAKAFNEGWGGIVYKTIGVFIADECSPRFDNLRKENTPFLGFKNMEQISDKPLEKNLEMMSKLKKDFPNKVLVASIMGSNEEEWKKLSKLVTEVGSDIIELNFSCPQMTSHDMGSDVGQNEELVYKYTKAVCSMTHLPVIAKMTPNIGNIEVPSYAAVNGGAAALAAINTVKSITGIDIEKLVCHPAVNGKSSISGYSGKAIKPMALRFITELSKNPKFKNIPISGTGGIETWRDAVEFFMVGASNLQITTSVMQYGYRIVEDMITGVSAFLNKNGYNNLTELVGLALPNIIPAEDLDRDYKILPNFSDEKCVGCGRCHISCYDGAHQAIDWNMAKRRPVLNENCVGCMLCKNVCPIEDCITYGEIKFKPNKKAHKVQI